MIRRPPRSTLFPTRRSSDLEAGSARRPPAPGSAGGRDHRRLPAHSDERDPRAPFRDRKSTRLNSSHSQISYAVFCLKKKKTPPHTSQANRQTSRLNLSAHYI